MSSGSAIRGQKFQGSLSLKLPNTPTSVWTHEINSMTSEIRFFHIYVKSCMYMEQAAMHRWHSNLETNIVLKRTSWRHRSLDRNVHRTLTHVTTRTLGTDQNRVLQRGGRYVHKGRRRTSRTLQTQSSRFSNDPGCWLWLCFFLFQVTQTDKTTTIKEAEIIKSWILSVSHTSVEKVFSVEASHNTCYCQESNHGQDHLLPC